MTDLFSPWLDTSKASSISSELTRTPRPTGRPSNDVYARVGDSVLRAARDGVRGGMTPEDIIRQIAAEHDVRLSLGDFRLLLASRRIPERETAAVTADQEPGPSEETAAPS